MPGYSPVIPEIAQAFQNDPRTRLAQNLIEQGTANRPVATGGWGVTDGLARALQATLGGYIQGRQAKKYRGQEEEYQALIARALGGAAPSDMEASIKAGMGGGAANVPPPPGRSASPPMPAPSPVQGQMSAQPPSPSPSPQAQPVAAPSPQAQPVAAPGPQAQRQQLAAARLPSIPMQYPHAAITSPYGAKRDGGPPHSGVDFDGKMGDPVLPVLPGVVSAVGHDPRSGNFVKVRHFDGSESSYSHLSTVNVQNGQAVKRSDAIGAIGNTGHVVSANGDGSHLHLRMRDANGRTVNPMTYHFNADAANAAHPAQASATPASPADAIAQTLAAPVQRTPDPVLPPRPDAPAPIAPVKSRRAEAARTLLQSGNPFAAQLGIQLAQGGMDDEFKAAENAADRLSQTQNLGYQSDLNNYTNAQQQQRGAAYGAQADERQFAHADTVQTREFGQQDKMQGRQFAQQDKVQGKEFAHDMQRAGFDRETSVQLANINGNFGLQQERMRIDASKATADEKAAAKRNAFLSTPAGARFFNETTNTIQQNDRTISDLQQFVAINEKSSTGGLAFNTPGFGGVYGVLDTNIQQMRAITERIAPMMRQAGQGSMSDKDLAAFRSSVPNVQNNTDANRHVAARLINGMSRMNDFERNKLEAVANGTQVQFMRDWEAFRNAVPVDSGKTFEEWHSSLRTVK